MTCFNSILNLRKTDTNPGGLLSFPRLVLLCSSGARRDQAARQQHGEGWSWFFFGVKKGAQQSKKKINESKKHTQIHPPHPGVHGPEHGLVPRANPRCHGGIYANLNFPSPAYSDTGALLAGVRYPLRRKGQSKWSQQQTSIPASEKL